jgi:hypothetical protein
MTDTNTTAGEQPHHSPAQLNDETWRALLTFVSGRVQHLGDPSMSANWRLVRMVTFMRFPIDDDLRLKAVTACINSALLGSGDPDAVKKIEKILDEIAAGEARAKAVIHG